MLKSYLKRNNLKKNLGLTLVELLVVISIFLVISSVAIFNYGGFRSSVSLQNLTDDIALSIRKAQSFAIGARAVGGDFYGSYGIHFSSNPTAQSLTASNKSFLMFSVPFGSSDKRYVVGTGSCGDSTNKCIELFSITTADMIKTITINDNSQTLGSGEYLDVVFTRPDPRAYFCYRTSIGGGCSSTIISNASITVSNGLVGQAERTKIISVQNTGQISIQ